MSELVIQSLAQVHFSIGAESLHGVARRFGREAQLAVSVGLNIYTDHPQHYHQIVLTSADYGQH